MTVEFEVSTVIGAPREAVFDLSLDIDAHLESMAASGERAVGVVGRLVERLVLARYLEELIHQRSRHTKAEAERRHRRAPG